LYPVFVEAIYPRANGYGFLFNQGYFARVKNRIDCAYFEDKNNY